MPPLLAGELTTAQMGGQGSPHRDNFVSGKILLLIMKMFAAHATPFEQQLTPGHRTDEYSDAGSISIGHRRPASRAGIPVPDMTFRRTVALRCAAICVNLELMLKSTCRSNEN